MPTSPSVLAMALPGSWRVRASNMVHWLSGERLDPTVTFAVVSADPLEATVVEAFVDSEGRRRVVRQSARWAADGFVVRGRGLRGFSSSRWTVPALSSDGSVLVVVHESRQAAGDGFEVLVRDGAEADGARASVAQEWEDFGLSAEDFAKLSWFPS